MDAKEKMKRVMLRRLVREALDLASPQKLTSNLIEDAVESLGTGDVAAADIREAMEWNQRKGYITYEHNEDLEVDLWSLTDRGVEKVKE
jgi:hypothetical protein